MRRGRHVAEPKTTTLCFSAPAPHATSGSIHLTSCGHHSVAVSGGLTFAAVSTESRDNIVGPHTCGVTPSGAAYCWAYNGSGQLGNGTTTYSLTPIAVSGGLTF